MTLEKNCICLFIEEADEWAKQLQSIPIAKRGPLYGLPLSVKECFYTGGYDSSAGLSKFLENPHQRDGPMIQRLKELGVIPFCMTNIPQTMETYGCSNPIYGPTLHPFDDDRTPGGSSGGEACLIAKGGSILGMGTDGGGSLRIPSHFCGIVTLKPTDGRIILQGRNNGIKVRKAFIRIYYIANYINT